MKPMKYLSLVSLVAIGCLTVSCRSTVAMSSGELTEILKSQPQLAQRMKVSLEVNSPGEKSLAFPEMTIRTGESLNVRGVGEYIYPAAYVSAAGVPGTPSDLTKIETGITLDLKARNVGQVVMLSGKVTVVAFDRFIRMGGEIGHPIVDEKGRLITENRVEMPAFRTYETRVYFAVKPGTPGTFEIDHPKKGTRVTVNIAEIR